MKKPIIAVRDIKIGLFDQPFVVRHVGEAIREWDIVSKNEQTKYGKNPTDFQLFKIADFDESTGEFTNLNLIEQLA